MAERKGLEPSRDYYLQTVQTRVGQALSQTANETLQQRHERLSTLQAIFVDQSRDQSKTIRSWTEFYSNQ